MITKQPDKLNGSVLLIGTAPPPLGGVTIHISRLTERLAQEGIEYSLLDEGRIAKPGVPSFRAISPIGYTRLLSTFRSVHIHSSNHFLRLFHTLAAKLLGRRVVQTVHSARGSKAALIALFLASRLADECIAVSEEVADRLAGQPAIIPAFVPPGADEETVLPDIENWLTMQHSAGRRVIAFNAYLPSKIKGVDLYGLDLLIDAFADPRVRDGFAAIMCVSVTDTKDNYFQELATRVEDRGLQDLIRFQTGQVRFAGILKRADLFVRPTITDGDALSIREAIWYGVPAIASDAVKRPKGAILFPSRRVEAFVEAILAAPDPSPEGSGDDFAAKVIEILAPPKNGEWALR